MFKKFILKSTYDKLKIEYDNLRERRDKEIAMNDQRKEELADLKHEKKHEQREFELSKEEAINRLRNEMKEDLIKSDLIRVEAVAKLEIYEKTDTKADANTIKEMIGKLIDMIGKQDVKVIK